jgi:hypothetical protein
LPPRHATRTQRIWIWLATTLLIGGSILSACQKMGDNGAPATAEAAPAAEAPAAISEELPAGTPYPPLQTVPPRPQLSYTVQQQRQIVEALIADRENARYTSQVVRYRAGLSSLPPPPVPPEPAVTAAIEPAAGPTQTSGESAPRLAKQETLVDFIAALRRQFQSDPPETTAPVSAEAEGPTPSGEPEQPGSAAPEALPDAPDQQGPAPAAGTSAPAADQEVGQAPVPPGRSAVAARLEASPSVIDEIVDETVAQTPLPPEQSALAARLAAADQIEPEETPPAAPLPAPRPASSRSAEVALPALRPATISFPAPPPIKPILPAGSSTDRAQLGNEKTATAEARAVIPSTAPNAGT